jgi:NADPH:quinone reductase-like Zn-dependent oxidoreductase
MSTMKAVRIHAYGGTDVLAYEDAPRPTAGAGEVLIRVYATSVNPFDCAVRAGYTSSYFQYNLPLILGVDVSGVVEAVGPGVTNASPGDVVYTRAGIFRDGANAEYVVAFAADLAAKPPSLDHVHAAALPHVTLTAWQALVEMAQLSAGQTVLIHGAAGGVGHIAVQLAHWRGAKVIGTASINLDLLKDLKVEEAIDYSKTPFESVVHDVDVVLDMIGDDVQQRSYAVLKPGGMLLSTAQPPSEETAQAHGVRVGLVATAPPVGPTLTTVAGLVANGTIKPVVSTVLPLSEIRRAHEMIEGKHTRGKVALRVAA